MYFRFLDERLKQQLGAKGEGLRSQPPFAALFHFVYPEYGGIVNDLYK